MLSIGYKKLIIINSFCNEIKHLSQRNSARKQKNQNDFVPITDSDKLRYIVIDGNNVAIQ